jgi:hypothetical protein
MSTNEEQVIEKELQISRNAGIERAWKSSLLTISSDNTKSLAKFFLERSKIPSLMQNRTTGDKQVV